jgi:hypothetical protein
MKTYFLRKLACAACVAVVALTGSAALAQEIQLASTSEMNNVYARLAELESRVASSNIATKGGDMVDECCDPCRAGCVAGAELLFLRPYESDGDFTDFDYEDGYRFWLGWQSATGLGARIRYFDLEAEEGTDVFEVSAVDFEAFDTVHIGCYWDLNIGAGLRYLDLQANENALLDFDEINGVGPVVSAELTRHFGSRGWAAYAIVRESIIVGDGAHDGLIVDDLTVSVSEIQLGLQHQREWRRGGLLFGRIGWESQYYHDIMDGDASAALMGVAFSAGIMR